jgi:prepilin-type N-terminal cleavage/methylation domain-containing protein
MTDVRRRARRRTDGFTLLELLLAMTALAMITAICYGAFHLAIRAVERGEVAVMTSQRLRIAGDVLDRQVKSMVPYKARNEDGETYTYFQGTATSVGFVTANGLSGGGRLAREVYQVLDDPPRLVLTETPLFSPNSLGRDATEELPGQSTVVFEGFKSARFEYLMNDGVDSEWMTRWDGYEEEMLPSAVRIVIEGLPGLEAVEGSGETVAWGTEKPVMVAALAEDPGDPDEGLEQGTSDDEELGDTGDTDGGDEADVDDEGDE